MANEKVRKNAGFARRVVPVVAAGAIAGCADTWRPGSWPPLEPVPHELQCRPAAPGRPEVLVLKVVAIRDYDGNRHASYVRPKQKARVPAAELVRCFDEALDNDPRTSGHLDFRAAAQGAPACFEGTTLRDGALVRCAVVALGKTNLQFERVAVDFVQIGDDRLPNTSTPPRPGSEGPEPLPDEGRWWRSP